MRPAALVIALFLCLAGALSWQRVALAQSEPVDKAELAARLEAVRGEIEAIRERLSLALGERDQALDRLAESEREVSRLERSRRLTQTEMEQVSADIEVLDGRLAEQSEALGLAGRDLARQLNLVHRQGNPSRLKLLLNQDDPRQVNRQLAYHGYLSRQRLNLIAEMRETLARLEATRSELDRRKDDLERLAAEQDANLSRLQGARSERETALQSIEQRVQSSQERLQALEEDERELARLLDQLAASLADIPPEVSVAALPDLRGRLPRPVAGQPSHRFGEVRAGDLTWNGWLIPASTGTEVRSVAHGRVAYADWLRGYGLILIIDHGDGYMSLYAHNEALLRDVGDWVAPGEVIATVGNSGGVTESGLYFELRRNGDPINPAAWLAEAG